MKPYPSVFHAYTSKLSPVICFFGPKNLDEVSKAVFRQPLTGKLQEVSTHGALYSDKLTKAAAANQPCTVCALTSVACAWTYLGTGCVRRLHACGMEYRCCCDFAMGESAAGAGPASITITISCIIIMIV